MTNFRRLHNTHQLPGLPYQARWLLMLVFATFLITGLSSIGVKKAHAEAPVLQLIEDLPHYDLAPHLNIIKDPARLLNFSSVYQRYQSGFKGQRPESQLIALGGQDVPHWIIFTVENKSTNTDWILTLGNHLDGRHGLFEEIFIYEHYSKKVLVDTLNQNTPATTVYSDIAISIPAKGTSLFFMYIVPKKGIATTISPSIVSKGFVDRQNHSPLRGTGAYNIVMSLVAGLFLALFLMTGYTASLYFSGYFLLQMLFFNHSNTMVYSDAAFANVQGGWYLALSAAVALLASRALLELKTYRLQNIILYGFWGLIVISIFLSTGFLPVNPTFTAYNLFFASILSFVFLAFLSLAQSYVHKPGAMMSCAAWAALLLGMLITFLIISDTVKAPPVLAASFWYVLFPQSALLFIACRQQAMAANRARNKPQPSEIEQKKKSNAAIIQHSKEAAENMRLKKLIKHERAVMNELREREHEQKEEMRKAKDAAEAANRDKAAFLAVVSHEIRTPMTGVMGMVRLLLDTSLSAKQADYAQTIQESGNAMLALLNDILDFEKIESGNLDIEIIDFDLNKLLHGVRTLMSGHAESKGIYLKIEKHTDVPDYIKGDPIRLRQILLNLIGNSIKFTEKGGVTLVVSPGESALEDGTGTQRLKFSINDTGVGISPEGQKKLFNPFSQAEASTTRKFGGTGLGLTISQKLVEAMGGRIRIQSEVGKGSSFYFTINIEAGSREEAIKHADDDKQKASGKKATKSLHILIVEDNKINQRLIKEFVDRQGHTTAFADTGEDAVAMVKDNDFDMVLMDVNLPGISGMGATKAIRALGDKNKALLPIIALSGNVRNEDIRECYAANMNGHLGKPVDPKKLEQMIAKVIEGKLDNPVEIDENDSTSGGYTVMNKLGIESEAGQEKKAESKEAKPETSSPSDATPPPPDKPLEKAGSPPRVAHEHNNKEPVTKPAPDKDDTVAPIRALAMSMEAAETAATSFELDDDEWEEDSFAEAIKHAEKAEEEESTRKAQQAQGNISSHEKALDHTSLESLKAAMPPEELEALVNELLDKTDEILLAMEGAVRELNYENIRARAHELKGMAANFGMNQVAALAKNAEDAAQQQQEKEIVNAFRGLPQAASRARDALEQWLAS